MQKLFRLFNLIHRHGTEEFKLGLTRTLTCEVFGFRPQNEAAILQHYEALRRDSPQLNNIFQNLRDISHVCELIKVLKDKVSWIPPTTKTAALDDVLRFILRLWLFAEPPFDDRSINLKQTVHKSFNSIKAPSNNWLWENFCADALASTAGFCIIYTHKLAGHLTFASRTEIRIFYHIKVARRYAEIFTVESQWYPDGLLCEYNRTMNLLWPIEKPEVHERVKRRQKEDNVDLEASVGHINKFDLRTYPFFGDRLAKIQERLEVEQQQRTGSTAFRIAITGILLTAFFGLVSAATGLASMWAGLRQVGEV